MLKKFIELLDILPIEAVILFTSNLMFFTHQHHKVYIVDQICSENYLSSTLLSLLLVNYPRKSFKISRLGRIQNQPSDQ